MHCFMSACIMLLKFEKQEWVIAIQQQVESTQEGYLF